MTTMLEKLGARYIALRAEHDELRQTGKSTRHLTGVLSKLHHLIRTAQRVEDKAYRGYTPRSNWFIAMAECNVPGRGKKRIVVEPKKKDRRGGRQH